ncbi:MAG: hypothetical protein ACRDMJ_00430 [Solirubrobacteraceae bacterium]
MPGFGVPLASVGHLGRLRGALGRYRDGAGPGHLELSFAAATDLVATLVAPGRPDLEHLRALAVTVPELGELVSCAADAAEQAVDGVTRGLWRELGLRSSPPCWTEAERETARLVFACACAPDAGSGPERLGRSLRSIAAPRFAVLLCDQLSENEGAWRRALAERYESVRHRCARRNTWRRGGLAELLRSDPESRHAVSARIERWLIRDGDPALLGGELEAALVHSRTPARLA